MLKGIPDDRDGLFDTIQRSKNHYQKRAYQCIKCMVALFSNCSVAYQILQVSPRPYTCDFGAVSAVPLWWGDFGLLWPAEQWGSEEEVDVGSGVAG